MIRKILLVIVLVFLITGIGLAFQNEPDGFRGLKWGDPPTEDMELYKEDWGDSDLYLSPADKMEIWNVKFHNIIYLFYKKKQFMEVSGFIRSKGCYDILETICREKYGKPIEEKYGKLTDGKYGESIEEIIEGVYYDLEWWGKKAWVKLYYNPIEKRGHLSITSRLIWDEKEKAYEEKKLKEEKERNDKQKGLGEKELIILDGTGQEASEKFILESGLVIFEMFHTGQHNFAVWLLDNNGKKVALLVNEIGYFDGSKAIRIDKTGVYLLDISADGYWAIIIVSEK